MIRVLQLVDSLHLGGAERMAVNIANALSEFEVDSHLCSTREGGALYNEIKQKVHYKFLGKKSFIDLKALWHLRRYCIRNKIDIVHAHGTSFFSAFLLKLILRDIVLVWHDHFGNRPQSAKNYQYSVLKLASLSFDLIYSVNEELKAWAQTHLNCKYVKFLSNFPVLNGEKVTTLKGLKGKRILCTANLREPKNHKLLIRAFSQIDSKFHDWTLHCVGAYFNDDYHNNLKKDIEEHQLGDRIFFYGQRKDIAHIMSQAEIGVLVSTFEGLPMAILEYGLGNLAVIATNVGYANKLISNPSLGLLVKSEAVAELVRAMELYMNDGKYRNECAMNFNKKVQMEFSEGRIVEELIQDYQALINKKNN